MRSATLLGGYARRHWLSWTAGWSFAFTIYASRIVMPLIGLALWTKALPGNDAVAVYYVATIFAVMATDSPENHTFAERVYSGAFTDELLRPHPVVLSTLGFNLAFKLFNVLGAIPVGIAVALLADVRVQPARVLMALPAVVLGSAIAFALYFTLAQSSFWTPRVHAVSAAGSSLVFLLGGQAAPIPLMPESIRPWVIGLPFRMINGFPSEVASGLTTGRGVLSGYALQIAWLAVLAFVSRRVWVAGVRRYVAVGG